MEKNVDNHFYLAELLYPFRENGNKMLDEKMFSYYNET